MPANSSWQAWQNWQRRLSSANRPFAIVRSPRAQQVETVASVISVDSRFPEVFGVRPSSRYVRLASTFRNSSTNVLLRASTSLKSALPSV